MKAIFKREFKAYFTTPIGYIILAAFYFFLGLYFWIIFSAGAPDIPVIITTMSTVTLFAMPIITMRLMSEDRRQKVDQALLTAPIKLVSIVLGKFLAALLLFALCFAPVVIFEIIIAFYVKVNLFPHIYSLFGMLLFGGALIAIGMFISCLTESPVVSAIVTLIVNLAILYMGNFAGMISVEWISKIVSKLDLVNAYAKFSETIFSFADIIYFISVIAVFIFLCVRSLEKRRWS